eukprot:CAMPEP_0197715690 /NCGR_PEP_ID=MMETSP1434-20131217/801_1 /TAXON_ID=265543 /ORGANISM="Minutocellus polymorphus, Strain CCMP3303" /LENGTH=116 /DNA_ID=CAMNT_0043299881 /DNA_START=58 /DNA_END=405 /DNA_ORIENTATION=+
MTRLVFSAAVVASAALLGADSAAAFNPTSDRRAALADVAKLLGGAVAAGTVLPQQASAGLGNPAQMGKGKKFSGQAFTPGKGLRSREEELLAMGNPAQLGKGKSTGGGQFIPGKGI